MYPVNCGRRTGFRAGAAVAAYLAGGAEPRDADAITKAEAPDTGTEPDHGADDLVSGHPRQLRQREVAVDDVQVRAAHAAGMNSQQDLVGRRRRNFAVDRL